MHWHVYSRLDEIQLTYRHFSVSGFWKSVFFFPSHSSHRLHMMKGITGLVGAVEQKNQEEFNFQKSLPVHDVIILLQTKLG